MENLILEENETFLNDSNKGKRLLATAFKLFTEKGIKNTSIQEIVDNANVGKGTFYLYFKDKDEIRDILIIKKTRKLFNDAVCELRRHYIKNVPDQVIFIINYVIDVLSKNKILLNFISKNLSWGIYNETVNKIYDQVGDEDTGILKFFLQEVRKNKLKLKNPDVTLYMIIELVSSTCFSSILHKNPLPIEEFKPFLYDTIRKLMTE